MRPFKSAGNVRRMFALQINIIILAIITDIKCCQAVNTYIVTSNQITLRETHTQSNTDTHTYV